MMKLNLKASYSCLSHVTSVLILCLLVMPWVARGNVAANTLPAGAPLLDEHRLWALGMIETGNNDREIGGEGEISRYQIQPSVWRAYSGSREYVNPNISVGVARQHWCYLARYFLERTGRAPTDFDMYVLWNTHFGYYAKRHFNPHRLASVVRDRAQRFVNLVHRPVQ